MKAKNEKLSPIKYPVIFLILVLTLLATTTRTDQDKSSCPQFNLNPTHAQGGVDSSQYIGFTEGDVFTFEKTVDGEITYTYEITVTSIGSIIEGEYFIVSYNEKITSAGGSSTMFTRQTQVYTNSSRYTTDEIIISLPWFIN